MKNEKNYDGKTSDVLKMVQEMDNAPPEEPEGTVIFPIMATDDKPVVQGYSFKLLQRALSSEEIGRFARTQVV